MKSWVGVVAVGVPLLATGALAQTPDPTKWAELQQRAKAEGELVITGPGSAGLRTALTDAFTKRFGINLSYMGQSAGETIARIDNETKAGKVSIDANLGGTSTCWALAAKNEIEDINGKLVDPEVLGAPWSHGGIKLTEPGTAIAAGAPETFRCSFQTTEWVMTDLFVNTSMIKEDEIRSWKDLLKPQYKGKIASYDPRISGPAGTTVGYLADLFGQDFLTQLYKGQDVKFTTDNRQLAEWVARGEYPIGLSLVQFAVETYRKQGLPIERIFPTDGQGAVTGGFSVVMLIKNAPHPNAAQLFANWFGTKEAQTIYETEMMETSMRQDVTGTNVPAYVRPKKGVAYPVDDYSWAFQSTIRMPALAALSKELER